MMRETWVATGPANAPDWWNDQGSWVRVEVYTYAIEPTNNRPVWWIHRLAMPVTIYELGPVETELMRAVDAIPEPQDAGP